MPIVINEVVVRATVTSRPDGTPKAGSEDCDPTASTGGTADDIVEKVFEILRTKRER